MSSFWTSIRGRKNSGSFDASEEAKPPSGRSSLPKTSKVSHSSEIDLQRQDSDEKAGKGCLKVSCLSRQAFPCKSLSSKLQKIQKGGTSSRKFYKGTDIPPTPLPTPEPDEITFPELSARPPVPESPKPKIKYFRKRAASASPSRFHGQNKKMFRGLSRERLLAPFPAPLRNLFRSRETQSKPDVSLDTKHPMRPMRKPGPLGRSWVKVYNDITFVDDTSEENYPILGHSGYPVKLPEADPLPKPPTPPPEKVKIYDIVVEDIKFQKQALIKEMTQIGLKASELSSPRSDEELAEQITVNGHSDIVESEAVEHNTFNTALSNAETQNANDVSLEFNEANKKTPLKVDRPSRNREAVRYKAKRSKRSGTPIAAEVIMRSPEEVAAAQTNPSNISDNTSDETMEDGYIIPQSLSPSKPPRGNKLYDKIVHPVEERTATDNENTNSAVSEDLISKSNRKQLDEEMAFPDRPKRGNKIYENISNKVITETKGNVESDDINEGQTQSTDIKDICTNSCLTNEPNSTIVEPPPKPKRKPKVYENVNNLIISDEQSNVLRENSASGNNGNIIETPLIPFRGHKGKGLIGKDVILEIDGCKRTSVKQSEIILRKEKPDFCSSENKENINLKKSDTETAPYATVRKDRLSKDLREISPCKAISDSPPPIPPKKRDIKSLENTNYNISLRPPTSRTSSKTRSAETSPSRPRRKRLIAQINMKDSSPSKPSKSTKIYTEVQIVRSSNTERSDVSNIDYNTDVTRRVIKASSSREFRQSCPLPPPPRPNKSPAIQRNKKLHSATPEKEIGPNIQRTEGVECVSGKVNTSLIKSSYTRRNRPPPPPPPTPKGKLHDAQRSTTSRIDSLEQHEIVIPNIPIQPLPLDSRLNTDIDMNLKNIEQSFETLDSVLHSLKGYATLPPAWSHERTKRRLSCDVVCDESAEIHHSINQNINTRVKIPNVSATHNHDSTTNNTFISDSLTEKGYLQQKQTENEQLGKKNVVNEEISSIRSVDEASQMIEFQVAVPSIISIDDEAPISENSSELSCQLNIEPIHSKSMVQADAIETASIINTALPKSPMAPPPDENQTNTEGTPDPNREILEQYEGEIKSISRGLTALRATLERCESDYSEGTPKEDDNVVCGTLLLGGPVTEEWLPAEFGNSMEKSDQDWINVKQSAYVGQAASPSNVSGRISYEIPSYADKKSDDQFEVTQEGEIASIKQEQLNYSFREHLNKNASPSKGAKCFDTNISDAAIAMDRVLEIVASKARSSSKQNLLCNDDLQNNLSSQNQQGDSKIDGSDKCHLLETYSVSTKQETTDHILEHHNVGIDLAVSDCRVSNNDSGKDQELNDEDSSEEVSEESSCTVEELKMRSEAGREDLDDIIKCEDIPEECEVTDTKPIEDITSIVLAAEEHLMELETQNPEIIASDEQPSMVLQSAENTSDGGSAESVPNTSELLHGVADITGKLEGIRSQLEAVISNYIPSKRLSDSSFDYTSSESPSSSISNRSSLNFEQTGSSSNASFYSLSQPSLSNYSLLSYYTARSAASPAMSESSINTPSVGSLKSDCDDLTEPELDDHC